MAQQTGNKDAPIRWRLYPWAQPYRSSSVIGTIFGPAFTGDPATSTIEPKPEWFPILEQWLPSYEPPDQPDRWMLQHLLTREPFNLRPDELNGQLSIENVIALLKNREPSEGGTGESNRADELRPAAWYAEATDDHLNTDRLRKAYDRDAIEGSKRGGRLQYTVASICREWPEHRDRIQSALDSEKCIAKAETRRK